MDGVDGAEPARRRVRASRSPWRPHYKQAAAASDYGSGWEDTSCSSAQEDRIGSSADVKQAAAQADAS